MREQFHLTTRLREIAEGHTAGCAHRDFFAVALALALVGTPNAAFGQRNKPNMNPVPGPMLSAGTETLETPQFDLKLVRSSQTVAALLP
ncbi:MAG TPA: hypothetical protein VMV57_14970, partial [Terracidiphilus sp.]|nr:hypothetical protein [Terracidiphilus sp.]